MAQRIRAVRPEDFRQIQRIHHQYFADQFEFPDFVRHYLCAFVIENDDEIIVAGGVRSIAEAIMVTNKDIDVHSRREAFHDMLTAIAHVSKIDGYDQVHAFVQGEDWKRHLMKAGFNPTKGESLVVSI